MRFGGRDPLRGRQAVDEVEVGAGAERVHRGVAERAGFLVLLGAGVDGGHRGEGLIGGQVAAGEGGGPGLLAEEANPAPLLCACSRLPLGQGGVDGEGGLLGQPQHLGVGLARELIR